MTMKRLSCLILSMILVLSLSATAIAAPEYEELFYDEEILSLLDFDQVHNDIWYFSNVIGPRLWGTPQEKRMAEDMAERFRALGIENVETVELPRNINGSGAANSQPDLVIHDYTDPQAAEFGLDTTFDKGIAVARGSTVTDATRTGPEGVTGTIVYAGEGLAAADFPAATEGNIALIERGAKTAAEVGSSYDLAVAAGAKAVLFIAPEPTTPRGGEGGTGWPTAGSAGTASWSTVTIAHATTPYAFVPDYAAGYLLEKPDTVVTYRMQTYDTFHQTVATIPGPSEDCDIIIFTGHMDTVTASPGGNDNTTGAVSLLAFARAYQILADQGKLDKEIVFAAVGAEETGLVGSTAIANARAGTGFTVERRDRIIACYNMDMGAPADAWNAGMTLTLRQHYNSGNVPPVDDIVSINSIAAGERLGLMVLEIDEPNPYQWPLDNPVPTNNPEHFAIKLTNGGGSDHAPFGALGIPNANHSFRIAHSYGGEGDIAWNGTVQLETRYHTTKDIQGENYSKERMEIALSVMAASSYAIARAEDVYVSTDAHLVTNGDYFRVNGYFGEVKNSNVAILNYSFDTSKFEYRGYTPAEGVTPIEEVTTDVGVKITVMIGDYNAKDLGEVLLSVKDDVELQKEVNEIALKVDYIVLDEETNEKSIHAATAHTFFTTTDDNDTWTLIDLSNLIDIFGVDSSDPLWESTYRFFDFNNSGNIDIYDISYVAKLIE